MRIASSTPRELASFLWSATGPEGHACQLYRDESELLDTLTGFTGGALWNGDAAIILATHTHAAALEHRLRESGLDLGYLRASERFVSASAESMLAEIAIEGWPQEARFTRAVGELVARAGAGGRKVRVFGELVAILWSQGRYAAAIHLEGLWNRYLQGRALPLLCAYPREGFGAAGAEAAAAVQRAHAVFAG